MMSPFKENDLILFTGDSVTDCDRNRKDPDSLGFGYAGSVASQLWIQFEELDLRIRNTGISGDRTCDLIARWDADGIDLQPDWISILIGINNTLRRYDNDDPTSETVFEQETRLLLNRVKEETNAKIILCAPFLLNTAPEITAMRQDLDPKIQILHKLALEFDAIWVDFDAAFAESENREVPEYWAGDGVHPSNVGHCLMAEVWMDTVCAQKKYFFHLHRLTQKAE
jgi:acyl-CoA thioesterase-1